jgi:hypothetical protein
MTPRPVSVFAGVLSDDPREAMALSRAMGFGGLVFYAHARTLNLPELSGTGRREFSHTLRKNAQTLVAIRADIGPKGLAPGADLDRLLAGLDGVLRVARDLDAELVTLDLGPLPEVEADQTKTAHVGGALQALCGLAERYRMRVALSASLSALSSLDRALQALRCPHCGVCLDPVALLHDRWSGDEIFSFLAG